jgi:catechol 2,3-dioxygenase
MYYEDPEGNIVELNVNNFDDDWAVTEQLQNLPARLHVNIDLDKVVAARKAGASPWEVHERAIGGEFTPDATYELHTTHW